MGIEELLQREETAWARLADALAAVPPERREVEGVVPGWSVHDVAWHCVYWAGDAGELLERILGGDADPPDSDVPDEEVLATGRAMAWDEILRRAEQGRERVREAFSAFADPPPKALELFGDETFDHYEEHEAQIRAFSA
jgi:uncharacterized damage-inducible protein DinB